MPRLRLVIAAAIGMALVFGAVTLYALEGREVVVVRTRDAEGRPRATRTWVADDGGYVWIEAANPERLFLHDLEYEAALELERGGRIRRCRAAVEPNPAGHQRIRTLLAAKYGWADHWIALVADTRRSLAVRLDCG
ncbi:MAG: hypothetical protein HY271_17800 [Deltaproteobacteria bacterium]|nr:hypothetical protein [Deltaproteobacteria bacterium]